MDEEFAWTFLSQRGPTLLHLVSTWEDLLIKEKAAVEVEVVVEEEAVIVIVMTIGRMIFEFKDFTIMGHSINGFLNRWRGVGGQSIVYVLAIKEIF